MTMTDDERELVRQRSFDCDGPVDVDVELGTGVVEVHLAEVGADAGAGGGTGDRTHDGGNGDDAAVSGSEVRVEVRHEPRAGVNFGLTGLLNWFGGQFGAPASDLAAEAVRETSITFAGNRLSVRGPRSMPLRSVPLAVVVHAPAGSSVSTRCGSAGVEITGPAGRVSLGTGSGDISVERAAGPAEIKTGSGTVRLGPMSDDLSARSGSGDVEVTSLSGAATLHSGSGDLWIGTVSCSSGIDDRVSVRSGSGDVTVAEAAAGSLDIVTGSGDLRIGLRTGALAQVDVLSGSGRVTSDLPVSDQAPAGDAHPVLRVRARTGSGDVAVTAATA